jgi:hypothetical protein
MHSVCCCCPVADTTAVCQTALLLPSNIKSYQNICFESREAWRIRRAEMQILVFGGRCGQILLYGCFLNNAYYIMHLNVLWTLSLAVYICTSFLALPLRCHTCSMSKCCIASLRYTIVPKYLLWISRGVTHSPHPNADTGLWWTLWTDSVIVCFLNNACCILHLNVLWHCH